MLEFAPQESGDDAFDAFEEGDIPRELIPLKHLPIDIEAGLTHTVTPDVYLSVLEAFYESIGERAGELNRFYETADWENYTIKVHALKSSARIIGADELGERAQRLENAGQENDIDYIRANHNSFMEEYRAFEEPLSAMFDNGH